MQSKTEFGVRYDRTAKVLTAIVSSVLLLVAILTQSAIVLALNLLILVVSFAYSPSGYTLDGPDVLVRRRIGKVRIGGVSAARRATADDLAGAVRLFASGGMFGYYGLFRNSKLGSTWWYVTDRDQAVVLTSNGKDVLVSPDDPDRFLAMLNAPAAPGLPIHPAAPPKGRWIGAGILGLGTSAIVLFAVFYAPGPPRYTITAGALEIHDRFYPVTIGAESVDKDRIRIVDGSTDKDWRPTARTNGFANPYYRSGWFRTANGLRVRMYRAGSTRLVLLPPKHDTEPVLLQVASPEAFIAELLRAWNREM